MIEILKYIHVCLRKTQGIKFTIFVVWCRRISQFLDDLQQIQVSCNQFPKMVGFNVGNPIWEGLYRLFLVILGMVVLLGGPRDIYIYSHFLIRNGLLWTHEEMSVSNSGILSKHVAYLPTIIPNSMANHPPIQPNNIFCLQQTIHMGLSENFVLIPPSIFCTHCPNTKRNPSMLATKSHF